jgi:hypothetical protein
VNTSVERFLEAATLVVPLFLTTRVCVLAAPVLGRTVSRWMLAVGIPTILVCALAGAAVLDRWPAALEAVLTTGLIVSLLLCLVWIPALLVKAGLWAFRRGPTAPAAPGPPRIPEGVRLAGAMAGVVVAVVFVQWGFYRDESRSEGARQDALRKMVGALQVVKKKGQEFDREVALLEAKLDMTSKILPDTLGVPRFMDEYQLLCDRHGFRVTSWRVREITRESLMRADIDLVLEGPPDRLTVLGDSTDKAARLATLRIAGVTGTRVSAAVTIYALRPTSPPAAPEDACTASRPSDVWMWPLRGRLRSAQEERKRLCDELGLYADIKRQVDNLEATRRLNTERVDAIEKLMAEHKAAEVVDPGGTVEAPLSPPSSPPRRKAARKARPLA